MTFPAPGAGLSGLELSDRDRLHLLRHFTTVSEEYLRRLAARVGEPPEDVIERVGLPGSAFLPEFASDPDTLWNRLAPIVRDGRGAHYEATPAGGLHVSFSFSVEEYPRGVGTDGIVALDDIPPELKPRLDRSRRDRGKGAEVYVLRAFFSRPTWQVHLVAGPEGKAFRIYTIFPGTYAPPLPDSGRMDPDVLDKSVFFWNSHALIEPPEKG